MKHAILFFVLILTLTLSASAQQDWVGAWQGKIEMARLRIVFNIAQGEGGSLQVTMDSPDQSAFGIPVKESSTRGDSLFISAPEFKMSYAGKRINDTTINGVFTQGMDIPLTLTRRTTDGDSRKDNAKKQTPRPPFPYQVEEVTFTTPGAGVSLSGTLTIPSSSNGKGYPAIVLVSGSGPQDRDETIFGHKPFAVLADHLTRAGMVVLRYDDRGTGKSTGAFSKATSLDFASDASAAVNYLLSRKEVDKDRVGILGHSEGGIIAPIVANKIKDVHFIIFMAAPGIPVVQLMTEQNVAILKSRGMNEGTANAYGKLYREVISIAASEKKEGEKVDAIMHAADKWKKIQQDSTLEHLGFGKDGWQQQFAGDMVKETSGPWMQYFLNYDPKENLQKLKAKVLALNGTKDDQVLATSNLSAIDAALKRSRSRAYKTLRLEGLNHLFQTCESCTIAEYGTLEETISTTALEEIEKWLKAENILSK